MTNILFTTSTLAIGRVGSMLLYGLSMVAVIGSILLLATFINKRITKKEQEKKSINNDK